MSVYCHIRAIYTESTPVSGQQYGIWFIVENTGDEVGDLWMRIYKNGVLYTTELPSSTNPTGTYGSYQYSTTTTQDIWMLEAGHNPDGVTYDERQTFTVSVTGSPFVDINPLYLYVGAGVLALAVVGIYLYQRKKR